MTWNGWFIWSFSLIFCILKSTLLIYSNPSTLMCLETLPPVKYLPFWPAFVRVNYLQNSPVISFKGQRIWSRTILIYSLHLSTQFKIFNVIRFRNLNLLDPFYLLFFPLHFDTLAVKAIFLLWFFNIPSISVRFSK